MSLYRAINRALHVLSVFALAVTLVFSGGRIAASEDLVTTVYLVRHAEKEKDHEKLPDPGLSPEGKQRALDLAEALKDVHINAIYVSTFKRTKDTAGPTETMTGLTAKKLKPRATVEDILKNQIGHQVLVVGHSDTVDRIAFGLLGTKEVKELPVDQYDRLFVITRTGDKSTLDVRKYGQPSPE